MTFPVLNLCNSYNSGNIACFNYSMFMHLNWKAHVASGLNFIVKGEELLKVTGSHVQWRSGNIFEMVLDRDVTYDLSNQ